MVERRKPLVLSSTKALINSLLNSSRTQEIHGIDRTSQSSGDESVLLPAGILRLPRDRKGISDAKVASLDDSALVGLPASVLKKLSITSGSLVFFFFSLAVLGLYLVAEKRKEKKEDRIE